MKNFLEYFSGTIYSMKQCLLTWKKKKRYPILVFIIGFIMLLTPVQFNFISTPTQTIVKQIPNIEVVLKNVANELNNQNIEVKIENNKLITSKEYEGNIEGFYVCIGFNLKEYPSVEKEANEKDNLIVFNEYSFYARYVNRDNNKVSSNVLSGNYSKANDFNFSDIVESESDKETYNIIGTLLRMIYLSNSNYNLLMWVIIIETFNLIFILIGSFILLYSNKKGRRDYRLTYSQTFLTVAASLILPSLLASIIGLFSFSFFTITYIVVAFIRLIMMCYTQLVNNDNYNQIKEKDKDNCELKF